MAEVCACAAAAIKRGYLILDDRCKQGCRELIDTPAAEDPSARQVRADDSAPGAD